MTYILDNIWLNEIEKNVLNQIIIWTNECLKNRENGNFTLMPDTKKCSEHFQYDHKKMLKILNQLGGKGLINKHRQLASGLYCAAYNGSRHSEVIPTETGFKISSLLLDKYPAK